MNTPSKCAQKELEPLGDITLRSEAMARCIGPLMALSLVGTLDKLRENGRLLPATVSPSALYGDIPSHIQLAERGLSREIESGGSLDPIPEIITETPFFTEADPTSTQLDIFKRFTYARGDIGGSMADTMSNHASLVGHVILPGILEAKGHSAEKEDVEERTLLEAVELLRSEDLARICRSMSFSANGAYEKPGNKYDALPVVQSILKKYSSSPNIDTPLDPQLLEPLKAVELFEVEAATGGVKLSLIAIRILRKYMELDNQKRIVNNGPDISDTPLRVNGSRGCPASIKTVRMAPEDLTNDQRQRLTTGPNPIAQCDEKTFTLLRSPIDELNFALADILEFKLRSTKANLAQSY